MNGRTGVTLTLSLLLFGFVPVGAQDPPPADDLIDAYVEAIGGRDAHLSLSSIRMVGHLEMGGMGLSGDFELAQAAPDRMRMTMELPQVGEVVTGFDGEVGWTDSPLTGPMLLEGPELEHTAEMADVRAHVRHPDLIPERETVGPAEYDGEACWQVRLVWASGRESHDCYSRETGLLLASEERQVSQMGEVPVTTVYREYREADGVRFPTRMVQETMGQEQVITIHELHVDTVDPSDLAPPESVRTLLD